MALTLNNKLASLKVGDYVWCKYTATSGAFGIFSDFAIKTDADVGSSVIPVASSATPNGYFKFICVGFDTKGRKKLIADRIIQHSISWDTLNTAGVAGGDGLPIWINQKLYKYTVRLMTGGISTTDKDNEWDKIIVESNLNGNITAGDNSIWNWNPSTILATMTSTRSGQYFVYRGTSTGGISYFGNTTGTSSVATNVGFRPVLLIENPYSYLFQQGANTYSIKTEFYDVGAYIPLTLEGGAVPNNNDFINNGIEDLNDLLTTNTNGVVISGANTLGSGNMFSFKFKEDYKNIVRVE